MLLKTSALSSRPKAHHSNTANSQVNHLFVIADNQAVVYGRRTRLRRLISTATLPDYSQAAGTCTYPTAPSSTGGYLDASRPVTRTCPARHGLGDGWNQYNAKYLTIQPRHLTISPRPITVTATASSHKVYDSTTTPPRCPPLQRAASRAGDVPGFTEPTTTRTLARPT